VKYGLTSVKDFGALGDGAADDGPAIRAAIAGVGDGGVLVFPAGTYLVAAASAMGLSALNIDRPNQLWILEPNAIVRLSNDSKNTIARVVRISATGVRITGQGRIEGDPVSNNPVVEVNSATDVTIEGITIDGRRTSANATHDGIKALVGSTRLTVRGVRVTKTGGAGIDVANTSSVLIEDCQIRDTYDYGIVAIATTVGCNDLSISRNVVDRVGIPLEGFVNGGIRISGTGTTLYEQIRIVGNHVRLPVFTSGSEDNNLSIEVFGGTRSVTLTANAIHGGKFGTSFDLVEDSVVSSNVIYKPFARGIELVKTTSCIAVGNALQGDGSGKNAIASSAPTGGSSNQNMVIAANSIRGFTTTGVTLGTVFRSAVVGNGIDMSSAPASVTTVYGVVVDRSSTNDGSGLNSFSTDAVISSNFVLGRGTESGNLQAGVYSNGCVPALMLGNDVRGLATGGVGVRLNLPTTITTNHVAVVGNTINSTGELFDTTGTGAMIGSIRTYANTGQADFLNWNQQVQIRQGQSAPEGVFAAGMGSLFVLNSGTDGASKLFVKQSGAVSGGSGATSTGWVAK